MARPRGRGFSRAGPKRLTGWFGITAVQTTEVAAGGTLVSSLSAGALALRPFTIVRTHLTVHARSDQGAASESYLASVAMCVVSEQAAAIGVTAVPTPITDQESDLFFLHMDLMGSLAIDTAVGTLMQGVNREMDSKAMRKVNEDQDVILVTEGGVLGGGTIIRTSGRMLVKFH